MKRPNLYDYIKVLALISMVFDHVGFLLFPEYIGLRIVGRLAFPLFLFLVGYNHSYKRKKSLRIWGIVLQIFLWIGYWQGITDMWYINILLAIGGTKVLMRFVKKYNKRSLEIFLFLLSLCGFRYTYEYIDYGTLNIVFAMLGYRSRKWKDMWYIILLLGVTLIYHLYVMSLLLSFGEYRGWLNVVGFILFVLLLFLTSKNTSLISGCICYDRMILWISKNALILYVLQIIVLLCVSSFVGSL